MRQMVCFTKPSGKELGETIQEKGGPLLKNTWQVIAWSICLSSFYRLTLTNQINSGKALVNQTFTEVSWEMSEISPSKKAFSVRLFQSNKLFSCDITVLYANLLLVTIAVCKQTVICLTGHTINHACSCWHKLPVLLQRKLIGWTPVC